jgi:TolA-binding protein
MQVSEDERTKDEGEEIRELRRELAEAHALLARTHQGLGTLATTLREVVARQARYERGLNLNSFIAYLLFTVLLGTGFYLLYRGRMVDLADAQEQAARARTEALAEIESARREVAEREEGARKAAELVGLAREGRRAELIARAPELALARLSPVEKQAVDDAVARARTEIVDASFTAGLEAARAQQWKKAVPELRRALGYEPEGTRAAQARYQLGVALLKQGNAEEAARELDAALVAGAERGAPELRYHLASALELAKQTERARTEYTRFADTKPMHPWAQLARRKAGILARMRAVGAQ